MQKEFIFKTNALKLRMSLWQHLLKEFIKEIHSPLNLGQIILNKVIQEVSLIV